MATFSTGERKRRPRGDRKSQEMTIHLREALTAAIKTELYPKSQIDIFLEVRMLPFIKFSLGLLQNDAYPALHNMESQVPA